MDAPRSSPGLDDLARMPVTTSEGEVASLAGRLVKWTVGLVLLGGILYGLWRFLDYSPAPAAPAAPVTPAAPAAAEDNPAPGEVGPGERVAPAPGFLPQSPSVEDGVVPTPEPLPPPPPIPETVIRPERIEIPSITLDAPVKAVGYNTFEQDGDTYVQWAVPNEFAVGWAALTAGLGQPGNTVLDGHHNVFGEVFRSLVDISIGDQILMYSGQAGFEYTVTEKYILPEVGQPLEVRQKNAEYVLPTDDERLTIITCWPYTSNTHRLVVIAKPIMEGLTLDSATSNSP